MPELVTNQQVWTYADAVGMVLDAFDIGRDGLNQRRARGAVLQAYRDLPNLHEWAYYNRQRLLQTVASYSEGTVEFDYNGGSSELLVTLTDGVFPSWAEYGRLVIGDVHYDVDRRLSDTTLTLSSVSNPGEDVAAGTAYTLYRSAYPMPQNLKTLLTVWDVDQTREVPYVDTLEHHTALQVFYTTPSTPWQATVRATGKRLGGWELVLGPPPNSVFTYDVLYVAKPRPLVIDEYSSGSVSVTSGGTTVTLADGTFPETCEGSVIRFSAGQLKPSSILGALDGGDNPAVLTGIIKSRTDGTTVELEQPADQELSGVAYTISDPLDIEPDIMFTALLRVAEAEFARLKSLQDWPNRDAVARREVIKAKEADNSRYGPVRNVYYNPFKYTNVTSE